ncbi:iron-containing alcohol dehydrogenase [Streptomyces afghaniensis]|uniref:iron-containing alcohol dehydrogenase n=1 Tax=Streptomyces afghaniensis TaxID=66865 RepID=UPI0037A17A98
MLTTNSLLVPEAPWRPCGADRKKVLVTARSMSEVVAGFTHDVHAVRVVFAVDAHRTSVQPELDRLGAKAVLVMASASQKAVAGALTAAMPGGRAQPLAFSRSRSVVGQLSRAYEVAAREEADCLVAIGSGAVIHAARQAALRAELPLVALPTSYAGAEFVSPSGTPPLSPGRSGPAADMSPASRVVIYDPALTVGLPDHVTARSAMRALAYGVDVLCTPDASPVAAMMAEEGIRQIADGMPDAILHPHGLVGRSRTQYGGYLTASSLAVTPPGPHRALCEAVERVCGLRHADVRPVLLPHLLAATSVKRPLALARVAEALGCNDAVQGIAELAHEVGAARSLRELGMGLDGLDAALEALRRDETAARDAELEPEVLTLVVENAYHGRTPVGP